MGQYWGTHLVTTGTGYFVIITDYLDPSVTFLRRIMNYGKKDTRVLLPSQQYLGKCKLRCIFPISSNINATFISFRNFNFDVYTPRILS